MEYFGLNAAGTARDANGSERGLLVMNHEAITDNFLHAAGVTPNPRPASEADKEIPAHGISIVEVRKANGQFATQQASSYNRRITPFSPMQINGLARGSAVMKTKFSTTGNDSRGTINNCGTGYTPWGTYLSGEENWAGYFTRSATDNTARGATSKSVVSLNRYGRAQGAASRHGWQTAGTDDKYARWDVSQTGTSIDGTDDYRNELNTFGYMVEVDPYDKAVAIRKRTSMGRFAHESGVFGKLVAGKPIAVYMGDDSRNEYIYKFVSTANWDAADANPANRITTGDKYLDSGKLYVAKFNADGTGQWVELSMANATVTGSAVYAFADNADVVVNARLAADAVGATKMDRPEWCAVHPTTGEIYYTLTNNSTRKLEPVTGQSAVDAANPRSYTDSFAGGAQGSAGNVNGHILRMREAADASNATSFTWDVYLFGAQADADLAKVNLSTLTNDQDFSSPDGLWFSPKTGLCFIQTDDGAYTDATNCMLLIGLPGKVGDGTTPTLSYTKADVIDPSKYLSHWPGNAGYGAGGATARPRSATLAITKNDGGLIGT